MTAATIAIKSKNKVDVLLLDRNPEAEVGKKTTLGWVCGDAVGEHHIKFLNEHLGVTYGKPEMENRVTAVYVYSPDMKVRVPFEGPGYVLDRPKFGRRLLEDALKAGVEFRGGVCQTLGDPERRDRKSTRLNSSHTVISYAVFCLKKKK